MFKIPSTTINRETFIGLLMFVVIIIVTVVNAVALLSAVQNIYLIQTEVSKLETIDIKAVNDAIELLAQ